MLNTEFMEEKKKEEKEEEEENTKSSNKSDCSKNRIGYLLINASLHAVVWYRLLNMFKCKRSEKKGSIEIQNQITFYCFHTLDPGKQYYQFAFHDIQFSKRNVTIICVIAKKNIIMTPTRAGSKHVVMWSLKK